MTTALVRWTRKATAALPQWTKATVTWDNQSQDGSSSGDESDGITNGNDSEDPLAQIDDDDYLSSEEGMLRMDVPDAFLLQASRPPALDQSLVKRGVLVELGLGWFGGLIARTASQSSRRTYDYRVTLHSD
ncbi:unnamed protein product, partial [Ectocarpus sp. 12 AP-2014]